MGKRIFRVRPRKDLEAGYDRAQLENVILALLNECADRSHNSRMLNAGKDIVPEPRPFLVTIEIMEDQIL